ncbi:ABC transporter ATP-binding protein [Clostridium drakei]|uniref:Multidrug ABC transporter ATP-binding protein n=1 Tax=Clostridium drakei TaxID=332101 RepID=A0A2U8DQ09_9CLOT|nr:ABC transporter ATP-binding protein [Clostridium drakei]AWI04867.1 multidrug ABC transporter ATP-binding protein [Clostridium drakei]
MNILDIEKLEKSYKLSKKDKVKVLSEVNLKVKTGELFAIMGPSGSGKTTLLNIISGIDSADGGRVLFNGNDLINMSKSQLALFRRHKMGMVFQEFNLIDSLNVKENIMMPMILDKREMEEMEAKTQELTQLLGISDILNKNVYEISGGQKQRAAICRALVNEPDIIFADEPTGNLDSKSTKDVMNYLSKVNENLGTSVLMVTHDSFAASYCSRVVLLKDGKIISDISKKASRKEFFHEILDVLSLIGGDFDEF